MQILFVSGWYPYPPDNGARARIYNLLRELGKYHSVRLVCFSENSSQAGESQLRPLLGFCESVDTIPRREYTKNSWSVSRSLVSGKPPYIDIRYSSELSHIAKKRTDEGNPDIVIISEVQNLPLLDEVSFAMPVVLEQFEVGTIWDGVDVATGYKRITRKITRNTWARYVSYRLDKIGGITVPSSKEEMILRGLLSRANRGDLPVTLIPNGINVHESTQSSVEKQDGTLVYQGSLKFAANLDAMEYFVSKILPLVQKYESKALLRITGSYDGVNLLNISGRKGVELTGYLEDVEDVVSTATVCVIPLRLGSGTRIKALEAMALGTPVISTSKGVEGIEVQDGVHVLIADDPDSFGRGVVRLLSDVDLRTEIASNARRLVLQKYTWTEIGKRLSDFCEDVVMRTE
jgi:glycosyltransferase involved in cell wall biosynthesis